MESGVHTNDKLNMERWMDAQGRVTDPLTRGRTRRHETATHPGTTGKRSIRSEVNATAPRLTQSAENTWTTPMRRARAGLRVHRVGIATKHHPHLGGEVASRASRAQERRI